MLMRPTRWFLTALLIPTLLVSLAVGWAWWMEWTDPTPVKDVEGWR